MSRRRSLALCGGAMLASLAGCTALSPLESEFEPLSEVHGDRPVAYEHDRLRLLALEDSVRGGETIRFEVTNHGESQAVLGCQNPWTVQARRAGEWRDAVWTSANGIPLCALHLSPGSSIVEEVTITEDALAGDGEEVRDDLCPGRYRFVLLGTAPFLAVDFRIRE